MALTMRYAARSDVGLVRQGNEDSGYAGPHLLIVADGMGGHAAGELASAAAVAIVASLDASAGDSERRVLKALEDSIDEVGDAIGTVIAADPDLTGMGTTVTGLYWLGDRMAVLHVGDSRAYLLRDGTLQQLTRDHTYVQTLIDTGRITEEEAAVHPRRSLLMRALDGMTKVDPDVAAIDVRSGDRYLLCSDGLSGVVEPDLIAAVLGQADPTGAVTRLVDTALERGAPDNVTVVVADIVRVPDESDVAARAVPVVVGAAAETRVRLRLPNVRFPDDAQPDPDRPDAPPPADGPPTAPQPLIDADIIVPAAERSYRESLEAAARAERRTVLWRRAAITGIALLCALLIAASAIFAARAWVLSRWYLGDYGGKVAVYNGLPGELLGRQLSELFCDSGVPIALVPEVQRAKIQQGQLQGTRAEVLGQLDTVTSQVPFIAASGCAGLAP